MQTRLPETLLATDQGRRADEILRSCVHCGFCNATCPTYQLLGDELDGPRGRIYLIKDLLERGEQDSRLNQHLDRCLTCRSCETTCPSGVRYGELLEIARERADDDRPLLQRLTVAWLKRVVPYPGRFRFWVGLGRAFEFLLPARLRAQLPLLPKVQPVAPSSHARRVLLLQGCVQRLATPQVVEALVALLDARGIEVVREPDEGCCGGLPLHLGDEARTLRHVRHNLDRLEPHLDGVEAVISTASGCGVTVRDYGRLLPDDPRAARLAALTRDAAEYLANLDQPLEKANSAQRIAWHPPCTLQHGQKVVGVVEPLLAAAGYELVPVQEAHLCCGSAGTYAILQQDLSEQLRERKLAALEANAPELIATANVGCHTHLAAAAGVPVVHWVELIR